MVSLFTIFVKQEKIIMKRLPQITKVSTLAKTRIFEIQAVDLTFSNKTERTYERLKPANRAAVMVLPIDGEDLLMVREYAVGTENYELGFCKGLMELGETPEQSANREMQEELGLAANKLIHLRSIYSNPTFMHSPMHILLAYDFYPSKLEGDEPEPLELVRMPLSQLDQLVSDPNFAEARNLVAIYTLRDYLKTHNIA